MRNIMGKGPCILLIVCVIAVMSAADVRAAEVKAKGFIIEYALSKNVSSKEYPVTEPYGTGQPQAYVTKPVYRISLSGKVTNDLFRNIAFVKLNFSTVREGKMEAVTTQVGVLESHENKTFLVKLYEGEYDTLIEAELKSFYYEFKDGTGEEVTL